MFTLVLAKKKPKVKPEFKDHIRSMFGICINHIEIWICRKDIVAKSN